MKLLPQSMFGRLFTSLLLAVGITLLVMLALVIQDRRELSLRVGGVGDTSQRIAELVTGLAALEPPARADEIARLADKPVVIGQPRPWDGGPPPGPADFDAARRSFASELRERLGGAYAITVDRARRDARPVIRIVTMRGPPRRPGEPPHGPGGPPPRHGGPEHEMLDIGVTLPDGGLIQFRVTPPPGVPPLPTTLFLQLGILTVVLAAVLFIVTRGITRPLSDLARAAEAAGRKVRHPPVPERGVREIREATRAFNAMQDRLLRYLDSRTRVLAAMSHDLRTPLTRMRLRTEAIDDPAQRSRFESDLEEMETMVANALGLFRGFDEDEAFEPTDLGALLETLREEFTEMGAQVTLQGNAGAPLAARPLALRRCFINLVVNAVKFGGRADIMVEDGDTVTVRIRDAGPGIPEADLERVFEPFFRLESSRSRTTGGTGLGLAIARDQVQAHGGTVVLKNRPEGGLEAIVSLPRG